MYDYRQKSRPLSSSSNLNDFSIHKTVPKSYLQKADHLQHARVGSSNSKFRNIDSGKKQETCFNSVRLSNDNNNRNSTSRCKGSKPSYLSKHSNLITNERGYKGRAASSSLNRRGDNELLRFPSKSG